MGLEIELFGGVPYVPGGHKNLQFVGVDGVEQFLGFDGVEQQVVETRLEDHPLLDGFENENDLLELLLAGVQQDLPGVINGGGDVGDGPHMDLFLEIGFLIDQEYHLCENE